jgi:hypothetical protein
MDRRTSAVRRKVSVAQKAMARASKTLNVRSSALPSIAQMRKSPDSNVDPYIPQGGLREFTMCQSCHAIYHNKQWYLSETWAERLKQAKGITVANTTCPACRKMKDHLPGGVVTLEGEFLKRHQSEILQLIKNEERRAMGINPLERIIELKASNGSVEVTTTTEKLAQRIGKVVHRAYSGALRFKWSEDVKLTRVYWSR